MTDPGDVVHISLTRNQLDMVGSAIAATLRAIPLDASSKARSDYADLFSEWKAKAARATNPEASSLLTPTQYAARHGLTRQAVTAQCRNGRLPAKRIGGRWLIEDQ